MNRRGFLIIGAASAIGASLVAHQKWWMTRRTLIRSKLLSPPANLLRNAAFMQCTNPGLPDYWGTEAPASIQGWDGLLQVGNDSPVEGAKSIMLSNPQRDYRMSLEACGTFVPQDTPYTFSVFLKSDADQFQAALSLGWSELKQISVGREWERHSFAYCPVGEARLGYSINARVWLLEPGMIHIAAPQLELGEAPTEFSLALMDDHPLPLLSWDVDRRRTGLNEPFRGLRNSCRLITGIAVEKPDEWCLDDIAQHGFNAVVFLVSVKSGNNDNQVAGLLADLDAAQARGLGVIPFLSFDRNQNYEQIKEGAFQLINKIKHHPSIIAWQALDEPSRWWQGAGRKEKQIAEFCAALRHLDETRPVFVNDNQWTPGKGAYGSLDASELGCMDLYPIGQYENAIKLVADQARAINEDCAKVGKATAFWLQLYGHGDAVREPTPEEARAMTYLNLIHGTSVLLYWIYKPMCSALWEMMPSLRVEINRLERVFLEPDARLVGKGTSSRRVHYALWEVRDQSYLIACNAAPEAVSAWFDVVSSSGKHPSEMKQWYGCNESKLENGRVIALFEPLGRQVFELW